MIVFVNNAPVEVKEEETIPGVLQLLQLSAPKGIAVAVNNEVISRADWEHFTVRENDQVTVIRATQGG